MQKIIQRRRRAEAWREIVSRQERSGISVQAFCQREGISAASLYGWRSRLGAARETQIAESRSVERAPTAEFADLGGLRSAQSRCEIRLDLGGGVVLQLVRI